jgi:predicted nuclease of restriction endonuclease-like (RecB) superfamily
MLKKTENYKTVYLGYDRTVQEREARKKLVEKLKQKQAEYPKQYHFIRNNAICSRTNGDQ